MLLKVSTCLYVSSEHTYLQSIHVIDTARPGQCERQRHSIRDSGCRQDEVLFIRNAGVTTWIK